MITINSQLQQRKDEIAKKVKENNNLKEEIKIMKKEQIQQNQKAALVQESNRNIIKDLEKERTGKKKCKIKNNTP